MLLKYFKFIFYFFFFKKIFLIKNKKIFFKNIFKKFNKFIFCLNCHNTKNIPLINNQKTLYLRNSLYFYKNFIRKSFYMNYISKDLSKFDIKNILNFFNE